MSAINRIFSDRKGSRILLAILVVSGVVSFEAFWNFFIPSGSQWNHLLIRTLLEILLLILAGAFLFPLPGATRESRPVRDVLPFPVGELRFTHDGIETAILQLLEAPVLVLDRDRNTRFMNQAAERLTGYHLDDVHGLPWIEMISLPDTGIQMSRPHWISSRNEFLTFHKGEKEDDLRLVRWMGVDVEGVGEMPGYVILTGFDITELRMHDIRANRFYTALESAGEAIFIADSTGIVEYANPAMEGISGYSKEELLGHSPDFLKPGRDGYYESIWKQVRSGEHNSAVDFIYTKDGGRCFCQETYSPVRDPEGKITHFVGILHDVTKRKVASDKLKKSEMRYRTLIENLQEGIFIMRDDRLAYVNAALGRLVGYEPGEVIPRNFLDLVHEEDRASVSQYFTESLVAEVRGEECDFRMKNRAGGESVYVSMKAGRMGEPGQRTLIGTVKDVGERRRREQEREEYLKQIREHWQYTDSIIEKAPVGIWIVDMVPLLEGGGDPYHEWHEKAGVRVVTVRVNTKLCSILGYTSQEMEGRSLFDPVFLDEAGRELFLKETRARRQGESGSYEARFRNKSGSWIPVRIEAIPVLREPETGLVRQSLSMIMDLTEIKQKEEELEQAQRDLKVTVKKLFDANQRLEESFLQLEALSTTDSMTSVANRRRMDEFLRHEWRRSMRIRVPISLILTDIDFFKYYNDIYGHQGGDECLVKVARILDKTSQRTTDLLARYGGEEFIVILPETPLEGALVLAERIRRAVEDARIPHSGSQCCDHITLSLGVSSLVPEPGQEERILIELADRALYRAKSEGRNRVYTALDEDVASLLNAAVREGEAD